jgi:hypothetical protein
VSDFPRHFALWDVPATGLIYPSSATTVLLGPAAPQPGGAGVCVAGCGAATAMGYALSFMAGRKVCGCPGGSIEAGRRRCFCYPVLSSSGALRAGLRVGAGGG